MIYQDKKVIAILLSLLLSVISFNPAYGGGGSWSDDEDDSATSSRLTAFKNDEFVTLITEYPFSKRLLQRGILTTLVANCYMFYKDPSKSGNYIQDKVAKHVFTHLDSIKETFTGKELAQAGFPGENEYLRLEKFFLVILAEKQRLQSIAVQDRKAEQTAVLHEVSQFIDKAKKMIEAEVFDRWESDANQYRDQYWGARNNTYGSLAADNIEHWQSGLILSKTNLLVDQNTPAKKEMYQYLAQYNKTSISAMPKAIDKSGTLPNQLSAAFKLDHDNIKAYLTPVLTSVFTTLKGYGYLSASSNADFEQLSSQDSVTLTDVAEIIGCQVQQYIGSQQEMPAAVGQSLLIEALIQLCNTDHKAKQQGINPDFILYKIARLFKDIDSEFYPRAFALTGLYPPHSAPPFSFKEVGFFSNAEKTRRQECYERFLNEFDSDFPHLQTLLNKRWINSGQLLAIEQMYSTKERNSRLYHDVFCTLIKEDFKQLNGTPVGRHLAWIIVRSENQADFFHY